MQLARRATVVLAAFRRSPCPAAGRRWGPGPFVVSALGSSDGGSAGPPRPGRSRARVSAAPRRRSGRPRRGGPVTTAVEPGTASTPAGGGPAPAQAGAVVASHFGLGLLIADRGNGRLLIVNQGGRTLWRFPVRGSLPRGQAFSADDAFIAPDGRTIVANDEAHQVIDRIDIVSRKVVWQYGHYARAGSAHGYLHTPDDAYPLANGNVTVADIRNCRILEISPGKRIVRQWGAAGRCTNHPPRSFNNPNGDTPLADGGMLVTTIGGSRVVRLGARGPGPVRHPRPGRLPIGRPARSEGQRPGRRLLGDRVGPEGEPARSRAVAVPGGVGARAARPPEPRDPAAGRDDRRERRLPPSRRGHRPDDQAHRLAVRPHRPTRQGSTATCSSPTAST